MAFLPIVSFAQPFDLGSWNILNLKYNYDEKWSVFGEGQLRSLNFYNNFHYYEYKGGVNFKAYKNLTFALGAGSYQTYKEGGNFVLPKNNNEFRIWPQVLVFQAISKLKLSNDIEQNLGLPIMAIAIDTDIELVCHIHLEKKRYGYKPFQISASNELFFTDKEPYFERNRLLLAFNYKPKKTTTLQLGYLHQFDYKINDETGRDFLQIGYFIEIFKKQSTKNTIDTDLKDN